MAHKVPRKSTSIDMTAMCDVAFLLLTFFMLATKFKPAEPVVVRTPTSVADIPRPDNSILITLDKTGDIYLDYDDTKAKVDLIEKVNKDKALNLSDDEMNTFIKGAAIGAPFATLKQYLGLNQEQQKNFADKGIPCDTAAFKEVNELAYWIYEARVSGKETSGKDPIVCIKCDGALAYPQFKNLMNMMTKNEIYTFNLLTTAEQVPEGTALYGDRILNTKKTN
jgi:biopolymer transport protein ExbD